MWITNLYLRHQDGVLLSLLVLVAELVERDLLLGGLVAGGGPRLSGVDRQRVYGVMREVRRPLLLDTAPDLFTETPSLRDIV